MRASDRAAPRRMRPETSQALAELHDVKWFHAVGEPPQSTQRVVFVHSWADAMRACASDEWDNVRIEWGNALTRRLSRHEPARYAQWNDLVEEVVPIVARFARKATRRLGLRPADAKELRSNIEWDVVSALTEVEFADVVRVKYYQALLRRYAQGRFPCGWAGVFPGGALMLF